jgi:dTMP kinase
MTNKKGFYIVFEGIVGCGKTTQSKLLATRLNAVWTREPGGEEISDEIRRVVQGTMFETEMDPVCEAYLYAASRAQTLRKIVKPALAHGKTVISDRSVFTSVIFQGITRNLGMNTVLKINKIATENILPDLIIFLDIPIDIALSRARDLSGDKFENMGKEFFIKVRKGYQKLAEIYKRKFVIIDGSGTPEEVADRIWQTLSLT